MSPSACLKDVTDSRILPDKDPTGDNLSSRLLITFSKHSTAG